MNFKKPRVGVVKYGVRHLLIDLLILALESKWRLIKRLFRRIIR